MTRIFEHPDALLGSEGQALGPTEWLVVTQDRINAFADATDDHQWIHVDPKRAKDGPFGGTIAHGYLTLSLVNHFLPELLEVQQFEHAVNYGLNKVRFPAPLPASSRIRARGEILAVTREKGAIQSIVQVTVEIDGSDRPACIAETISRYFASQT